MLPFQVVQLRQMLPAALTHQGTGRQTGPEHQWLQHLKRAVATCSSEPALSNALLDTDGLIHPPVLMAVLPFFDRLQRARKATASQVDPLGFPMA